MTPFDDFPFELLGLIIESLNSRADVANCRLVNKRWREAATRLYFQRVPIYAQWGPLDPLDEPQVPMPNGINYDPELFRQIVRDEGIRELVRHVDVYTCNPDCNHRPTWVSGNHGDKIYEEYMPDSHLSEDWHDAVGRIRDLPNLRGVSIIFDRHGGESQSEGSEELFQTREERALWVASTFTLLKGRIKNLSIRHYEVWLDQKSNSPADMRNLRECVLRGLESLRISLVHEDVKADSDTILKGGQTEYMNNVWSSLPAQWLRPATQLKRLVLYSDIPYGWYPKLDLRGVQFENLESLTLGQMMFAHDWQFDWIIAHQRSLRELNLDHCSILYEFGFANEDWLDPEGFPNFGGEFLPWSHHPFDDGLPYEDFKRALTHVNFPTRWHNVFRKFQAQLGALRTFRFGSSPQWIFDTETRKDPELGPGLPIMPWEAESDIVNRLFTERYQHYNDWTGEYGTAWHVYTEMDPLRHDYVQQLDWRRGEEPRPKCDDEDKTALEDLLRHLGASLPVLKDVI